MSPVSKQFLELLKNEPHPESDKKTLVIGIGNALKGDDGAGVVLLECLRGKVDADLLNCGVAPENYLEKIAGIAPCRLIIIDAADFGRVPGTMRIFRARELAEGGISTHSLSPGIFIEYLETKIEGIEVFVLGIQPGSCGLEEELSEKVSGAIDAFLKSL